MIAKLFLAVVCVAAAAFYLRFLIALSKEPERLPTCHRARLRLTFTTPKAAELQTRINTMTRVAETLDEYNIGRGGFR